MRKESDKVKGSGCGASTGTERIIVGTALFWAACNGCVLLRNHVFGRRLWTGVALVAWLVISLLISLAWAISYQRSRERLEGRRGARRGSDDVL